MTKPKPTWALGTMTLGKAMEKVAAEQTKPLRWNGPTPYERLIDQGFSHAQAEEIIEHNKRKRLN